MEQMDYWRLCDELSVIQAALLIVGEDPSASQDYIEGWKPEDRPKGFDAALSALQNAVRLGRIEAKIHYLDTEKFSGYEGMINLMDQGSHARDINWRGTFVSLENLKNWLSRRGIKSGFFFDTAVQVEDFLDHNHPCYALKLAAAVGAWKAVSVDENRLRGKTPKQAVEKWLRENASSYGLTKDDGSPNETGIGEISKIANWKPEGGAAKTPGVANQNPPTPLKPRKNR